MADERPVHETLLDFLVYAPLGAAITAAEEVPKLAERGRAHVEKQIAIARVVGKFAAAEGRRRVGGLTTKPAPRAAPPARTTSTTPSPEDASDGGKGPAAGPEEPTGPRAAAGPEEPTQEHAAERAGQEAGTPAPGKVPAEDSLGGTATGAATPSERAAGDRRVTAAVGALPIPGYDTLAASQVVERLASLSAAELEAVRDHESATRRRRTVLHRIAQLSAERDATSA